VSASIWKSLLSWWAVRRPPLDETKRLVEEAFLWGCQTAQRSEGVASDSSKFIVNAEIILNNRRTRMLGWIIGTKDGNSRWLLFRGKGLKPVIKTRKRAVLPNKK
jgi:hypothetical protein